MIMSRLKAKGKALPARTAAAQCLYFMDVANVMPGDIIRIELHYTEMITPTDGIYQVRLSLPWPAPVIQALPFPKKPEGGNMDCQPFSEIGRYPQEKYNINVNLSAGVPITDLQCGSRQN